MNHKVRIRLILSLVANHEVSLSQAACRIKLWLPLEIFDFSILLTWYFEYTNCICQISIGFVIIPVIKVTDHAMTHIPRVNICICSICRGVFCIHEFLKDISIISITFTSPARIHCCIAIKSVCCDCFSIMFGSQSKPNLTCWMQGSIKIIFYTWKGNGKRRSIGFTLDSSLLSFYKGISLSHINIK